MIDTRVRKEVDDGVLDSVRAAELFNRVAEVM